MITTSVTGDFVLWALFWLVVAWALWWGIQDIRKWLQQDGNGGADIRDFPDEARGETGPQKPTVIGSPRRDARGEASGINEGLRCPSDGKMKRRGP